MRLQYSVDAVRRLYDQTGHNTTFRISSMTCGMFERNSFSWWSLSFLQS